MKLGAGLLSLRSADGRAKVRRAVSLRLPYLDEFRRRYAGRCGKFRAVLRPTIDRDPKARSGPRRRRRRLQSARWRRAGSYWRGSGAYQRPHRPDNRRPSWPHRKRSGDGSIIEPRGVVDAVRSATEPRNGLIERNVGSASWRQSLLTPILEIEPLRNGLRANKARQSELVDSNIGEAANRRTAAITRPARG